MQPARRLKSITVVAVVGLIALTGCRSDPGVAAYVGDKRITEDRITEVVDEVKRNPVPGAEANVPTRSRVVGLLVFNDACERAAAERDAEPQNRVTAEQIGQGFQLSPNTEYARQLATFYTCSSALPTGTPVPPTARERADLVRNVRAANLEGIGPEVPDAEIERNFADNPRFQQALGQRNELVAAFDKFDITVNPRYRPLAYPILEFPNQTPALGVPLGEHGDPTVIDQR